MHDSLISKRVLVRVTFEVEHEHLNHPAFCGGCGQVDCLTAHVTVSMLGHLELHSLILGESVPDEF